MLVNPEKFNNNHVVMRFTKTISFLQNHYFLLSSLSVTELSKLCFDASFSHKDDQDSRQNKEILIKTSETI